jgi:hypothetical protein
MYLDVRANADSLEFRAVGEVAAPDGDCEGHPSGFVQIHLSQVPGRDTLSSARLFDAAHLSIEHQDFYAS